MWEYLTFMRYVEIILITNNIHAPPRLTDKLDQQEVIACIMHACTTYSPLTLES